MLFRKRYLMKKILAWLQLSLVTYALVYAGIHQYSNPVELPKACFLVDHHLHQNPDTHQCDLCDYHLRTYLVDAEIEISSRSYQQTLEIPKVVRPVIEFAYSIPVRGPPVS